jgi:hypothetical protein
MGGSFTLFKIYDNFGVVWSVLPTSDESEDSEIYIFFLFRLGSLGSGYRVSAVQVRLS